jgi:hypothetical protein
VISAIGTMTAATSDADAMALPENTATTDATRTADAIFSGVDPVHR